MSEKKATAAARAHSQKIARKDTCDEFNSSLKDFTGATDPGKQREASFQVARINSASAAALCGGLLFSYIYIYSARVGGDDERFLNAAAADANHDARHALALDGFPIFHFFGRLW